MATSGPPRISELAAIRTFRGDGQTDGQERSHLILLGGGCWPGSGHSQSKSGTLRDLTLWGKLTLHGYRLGGGGDSEGHGSIW